MKLLTLTRQELRVFIDLDWRSSDAVMAAGQLRLAENADHRASLADQPNLSIRLTLVELFFAIGVVYILRKQKHGVD